MDTIILGGGLAGLCVASFLDGPSLVLEKEEKAGGLCRSFELDGVPYDVGPHVFFSRNQTTLKRLLSYVDTTRIRRSNKIWHKGRLVGYPFENDLAALDGPERDYCLHEFLHNPYEEFPATTMLQFFLKTFGEGITRLYLRPYNEKIWKFDPAFMDTQMVERIPKPPLEDVINSANGIKTEGYTHQLFFHYPTNGGIQRLIDSIVTGTGTQSRLLCPVRVERIVRSDRRWIVETDRGVYEADRLINCMPLPELFTCLAASEPIARTVGRLRYNSLYTVVLHVDHDRFGDHLAFYFADRSILFHRLTRLDFLGTGYRRDGGGSTLLAEITFRPGSPLGELSATDIERKVIQDMVRLDIIDRAAVRRCVTKSYQYAYVIYDLDHRKNVDTVLDYLSEQGIACCGRFAEFEYLNMDAVYERSFTLARKLNDG